MTKYVIYILGDAAGLPCDVAGCYVQAMDFEYFGGIGHVYATRNQKFALQFDSLVEALAFYQTVSKTKPLRPDGHPNKPLTAYTVEFAPL